MSHGTFSYIYMYINAVKICYVIYTYDMIFMSFKIKLKLYMTSRSATPAPNDFFLCGHLAYMISKVTEVGCLYIDTSPLN